MSTEIVSTIRPFVIPILVSVLLLIAVGAYLGPVALFTAGLLVVLEVTLSFDNAVANARVLQSMSPVWQHRFLTWGIFSSVFITRVVLPILIVSASVAVSPLAIASIVLFDPEQYALLLQQSHHVIAAFGGMFLTMVGLKYFFDEQKEVHWIHHVERHFARWGSIEAVEIAIALCVLLVIAFLTPDHTAGIFFAGICAIVLFILMQGATSSLDTPAGGIAAAGFASFVYLEVLDASFSLDSVAGAFALSTSIPVIAAGLGIGAYFVRALTVYMVHNGTLSRLRYIEHGAHWAILGLAGAMFASFFVEVPEPITGLIGLLFVGGAYFSSIRTVPVRA